MKILIIGGNRFFGKHLAAECLKAGDELTLLNRGTIADELIGNFQRIRADRTNFQQMEQAIKGKSWDIVYDQICYDAHTAKEAVKLLRSCVGHYVFTSSISIYQQGTALKEEDFQSKDVLSETPTTTNYGLAKFEAEGVFAREMPNNSCSVRLGMVVGEDDYTGRLQWHINHVKNETAMQFPNLEARLSFIHSKQAGLAIHAIGKSGTLGAVNCAAPGGMELADFIRTVEGVVNKKAVITSSGEGSPYGITNDFWVDVGKLEHLGVKIPPTKEWMGKTITNLHKQLNRD
jgi:nucleoside-diphosphate-sugar epimerase